MLLSCLPYPLMSCFPLSNANLTPNPCFFMWYLQLAPAFTVRLCQFGSEFSHEPWVDATCWCYVPELAVGNAISLYILRVGGWECHLSLFLRVGGFTHITSLVALCSQAMAWMEVEIKQIKSNNVRSMQKLMKELAADVASAEEHAEFLADACSRLQENK